MYKIDQITSDPKQTQSLIMPDGTIVFINMYFMPQQKGWFVLELTYGDFTVKGFRIVNSPNMLRQFKNQIKIGFACYSKQQREPTLPEDFSSGNSVLYLLTQAEVEEVESYLANG